MFIDDIKERIRNIQKWLDDVDKLDTALMQRTHRTLTNIEIDLGMSASYKDQIGPFSNKKNDSP